MQSTIQQQNKNIKHISIGGKNMISKNSDVGGDISFLLNKRWRNWNDVYTKCLHGNKNI